MNTDNIISVILQIFAIIGALGLFLFGMVKMSEALQKVSGNSLRRILSAITHNRFSGIASGFLITAGVQSSSAISVMIVSFVNAGLLSLFAATSLIMGANIGTTITSWIISLIGFQIDVYKIFLPIIGIGLFFFFSKSSKRKTIGEFFIGLGILFLGLQFLKDLSPDLLGNPQALSFLATFTEMGYASIIIFIFVGAIITVLIQSSSAAIALTLVLVYKQLIPFELAVAMVLGENIGTTLTANIAAIVANSRAKIAARIHLIFNIIGVIWVLLLFHPLLNLLDDVFVHLSGHSLVGLQSTNSQEMTVWLPLGLSAFHTSFNIINTLLLTWFTPWLIKIAKKMLKNPEEDNKEFQLQYISSRLYSTAELSALQAKNEILIFAEHVLKTFEIIPVLLLEKKDKKYHKYLKKVEKYEELSDNMEQEIALYITRIARDDVSDSLAHRLRSMLKIIDELENISDLSYQISLIIKNKNEEKVWFNQEMRNNLGQLFQLTSSSLKTMLSNLGTKHTSHLDIKDSQLIEDQINTLRDKFKAQNIEDISSGNYKYSSGTYYSDLISLCEKIGDHSINITEAIIEYRSKNIHKD